MLNWLFRKGEQAVKFVVKKPVEELTYFFMGEKWWIVGPMGSGKTTMHKFLEGNATSLQSYLGTQQYNQRKKGRSKFQSEFAEKTNKANLIKILKKKGKDYGGHPDFWVNWSIDLSNMHRFVFIYSLELNNDYDLPASLKIKNGEMLLMKRSKGFQNVKKCLKYTLDELIKKFPKEGKRPRKKYRKLLIMCNKVDQWFHPHERSLPNRLPFYHDAEKELNKIVEDVEFEDKTGFRVIFKHTTFNVSEAHFKRLAFNNIHDILNDFIKDNE